MKLFRLRKKLREIKENEMKVYENK